MDIQSYKKKIFSTYNVFSLLITLVIYFFDRITKIKIIKHQENNNEVFVNDYLNLELIWNTGIGFGLLSSSANMFYHFITFFILIVILVILFLVLISKKTDKILYSLILGGALGNLHDRVTYFAVPDFIDFHYGVYHWFTFNIADVFITIGIILMILKELIYKENENN